MSQNFDYNFGDFVTTNICIALVYLILYMLIFNAFLVINYSRLFCEKWIPHMVEYIKNYFSFRRQKKELKEVESIFKRAEEYSDSFLYELALKNRRTSIQKTENILTVIKSKNFNIYSSSLSLTRKINSGIKVIFISIYIIFNLIFFFLVSIDNLNFSNYAEFFLNILVGLIFMD